VIAARGRYEGSIESIAPTISPIFGINNLEGVNTAVTGQLMPANFTTLSPAVLVQFLLNPGQVIFDVIAAKKRLLAPSSKSSLWSWTHCGSRLCNITT